MVYDEDLTRSEERLISLLKGKNRMEIDEILEQYEKLNKQRGGI